MQLSNHSLLMTHHSSLMTHHSLLRIIFVCFLFLLSSCQPSSSDTRKWMEQNGKLKVLSTTAMIHDLVRQIGGDFVDSCTLIKGELDPHSYQLVKGDDEKFLFADLIFYNGLGLEHGPSLQHTLQKNPKAVPLGNFIQKQDASLILHVNGQPDPHIWMDVSLWSKTVPYIVQALSQKDPAHAEAFQKNGDLLLSKLLETDKEMKSLLQKIPDKQRYLVTSHDAFNYFARQYLASPEERHNGQWSNRFQAPEGLAPDSQLSTVDIQHIIQHVTKYQIHVLFPESNISKDSIRKIVSAGKEKGLDLSIAEVTLYGDAMGASGSDGETYVKMMLHNAHTIAKELRNE